jgi:hypothetical protein
MAQRRNNNRGNTRPANVRKADGEVLASEIATANLTPGEKIRAGQQYLLRYFTDVLTATKLLSAGGIDTSDIVPLILECEDAIKHEIAKQLAGKVTR